MVVALKAGIAKTNGPSLDLALQGQNRRICFDTCFKILELLPLRLLDFERDLAASVEELSNLLEIVSTATPCGHRWRADTHTTRGERGGVAMHCIAVQRDRADLTDFLQLGTGQSMRAQIPEHEVVVRA